VRRTVCGGCGADQLEPFLDLGKTPLADRFPATPDEPEPTFPLELAVCRSCWLVQLLEVVDDDLLWSDYGFYSGASPSKVAEHETLAADLLAAYPDQAKRLTVEVGCNDGDLLRHFQDASCWAFGIDPAIGPAEVARERGLPVLAKPFGRKVAAEFERKAGLIIARNVAAHIADLDDFFGGIADLLAPDGIAVVEVQYLPDLLLGNQFDHVYHEHRFYFSLDSLASVTLPYHGLVISQVERTDQQGGSIRVHLRHAESEPPLAPRPSWAEAEAQLQSMAVYQTQQGRAEYLRARLLDLLDKTLKPGVTIAGYGATAKSTTLLNWCGIGRPTLPWIEDTTPAKIGRFSPGMRIPIVEPQGVPPDVWLLLAWNYLPGVLQRERVALEHGTRLLVPIPVPVLL
jgi:SAM-dependent methyltransferase